MLLSSNTFPFYLHILHLRFYAKMCYIKIFDEKICAVQLCDLTNYCNKIISNLYQASIFPRTKARPRGNNISMAVQLPVTHNLLSQSAKILVRVQRRSADMAVNAVSQAEFENTAKSYIIYYNNKL